MPKGLMINPNLKVEVTYSSLNFKEIKDLPPPPTFKNNVIVLSIDKYLDSIFLSNIVISNINQQIKNILGDNLSKYKFILSLETQENKTTIKVLDNLNKMIDNVQSIVTTINIEEIKKDSVIFLNNPVWIHCDLNNPQFFEFWKYIKRNDLGTIKKKFMFLNNHYSDIRFNILKFIYKNGFNRFGNISFNEIMFNQHHINLDEEKFLKEVKTYGIKYPKFYDTLPDTSHINEDQLKRKKLLGINHATVPPNFNYRIYMESFFEILTETQPHLILEGVHISEKIHKPLRTALPFVYYGNPKLKSILENIGLSFNSPIYFFGMNEKELFEHLNEIISKDFEWYHRIQYEYLDEYFNNMDKWNEFIRDNNKQLLKFMYI